MSTPPPADRPTDLLVLGDDQVRRMLPLEELADSLRRALIALSAGTTSVPARIAAFTPGGLLGAMPGYVPGVGLAAKLVGVYPGNHERGRPAHQALIAVFDETSGQPLAVMGGTYITAVRTAVTSAVAARALAPDRRPALAVLGAGVQAVSHLAAFASLLDLAGTRIWSRDPARSGAVAARHPGATAVPSARAAVEGADIVLCCTDSPEAVLSDEWIGPGAHVGSVGSGAELPAALVGRAAVFVESRDTATAPRPAGALELQARDPSTLVEVGDVLAGRHPGRNGADQITVFKSTGHAVEDVAAAAVVLRHALVEGAGTRLPFA